MKYLQAIVIIPARGGSKGIPRKNIKLLNEMPLIAYSILDAVEAQLIDHIYVSTDDAEIAAISEEYGASIIKRPVDLAADTISSESALIHAIDEINITGMQPDIIVFLQCTSPIRTGADIDHAIHKFQTEGADSLVSVSPSHCFLWEYTEGIARSINYDYRHRPRRQDLKPQYVENGSIYIFKPWVLKKYGNRLGGKISLFPLSEAAAHEIDSPLDFEIAEFLLRQQVASHVD